MAMTKTELRRALARDVSREVYTLGAVTSAAAGSVTVAQFIDAGADEGKMLDKWIYLPASATDDRERRITAWTPGTGACTIHRNFGITPSAAAEVELHRFMPSLLNQAIEDALPKLTYELEVSITPVANTNVYSLMSYPYIRRRDDILGIEVQSISGSYEGRMQIPWDRVKYDGATRSLIIDPPVYAISGASLILIVKKRFAVVTGLETESFDIIQNDKEELWVRAAMRAAFYSTLMAGTGSAKEVTRYDQQWRQAIGQLRALAKQLQPNVPKRLVKRQTQNVDSSGWHRGWV